MALTQHELTQIIKMHKCGAHPTLIAQFLERDPRVVLDALANHDIFGPWPKIPSTPLDPKLLTHARAILQEPTLASVSSIIDTLKAGQPYLDSDTYMLLLKALIKEREQLALKAT